MLPQLGTGSPTPSPKKESVTSARMYCGISTVACVTTTLQVSGRMWRRIRYPEEAPKPRAASTKPRSRALSTTPRIIRAGRTHPTVPMIATSRKNACVGGNVQRQESAHPEQQIQPGKRQEEFPAAHQQAVHPAAMKARERARRTIPSESERNAATRPVSSEIRPP